MRFLKDFLRNFALLIIIGVILLLVAPGMMKQVYEPLGALFEPLLILLIIVAALPRKKKSIY